jgi:hypothetical protein
MIVLQKTAPLVDTSVITAPVKFARDCNALVRPLPARVGKAKPVVIAATRVIIQIKRKTLW